jgi:tellurite methyltransferase
MSFLIEALGVDIQLIDQILKGRLIKESVVLDAGCGSGRNSLPLLKQGFRVVAFDPDNACSAYFIDYPKAFMNQNIAEFPTDQKYDFIICNAVLHFAKNHVEFEEMVSKLVSLLSNDGVLFIRMTSDMAFRNDVLINENGRCLLPDGSDRYLLTIDKLRGIIETNNIKLIEPVKTVNVQDIRCMTTLVFSKNASYN